MRPLIIEPDSFSSIFLGAFAQIRVDSCSRWTHEIADRLIRKDLNQALYAFCDHLYLSG